MASLSIEQLLTPISINDARATVISLLKGMGFKTAAGWQTGTLARTLGIELPALLLSDLSLTFANIAMGGYNDTASGDWLTLFSKSMYDNERAGAVRARGKLLLTSTAEASTTPIVVDQLVAVDPITGLTYRNKEAGTLLPDDELELLFEAELVGPASNVPVNRITELQTPIAGVSVNNPGADGTWLTVYGAREESDEELRDRNRTKWATRSYAAPQDAYIYWAREADPVITRASVDSNNPDGPGSLRIYIAGDEGAFDDPAVAEKVEQYINGELDGIVRRPLGSAVSCLSATEVVVTLAGTVYMAPAYQSGVPDAVVAALYALFEALPIGGTRVDSPDGKLLFASLYAALMKVPGVVNVAFSSIKKDGVPLVDLGDVPLDVTEVASLDSQLTFTTI